MNNDLNDDNLEVDEIEKNEEFDNTKELARLDITYYSIERSIRQILKWLKDGKLIIPDFQRDFVWDYQKACYLIDSVMVNLPIPNIFVFREIDSEKKETFKLIDGRQRIETFLMYTNEKFNGDIFNLSNINNSKWGNKSYTQLDDEDKDAFNDYPINITVFESVDNIDENKKRNAIIEIFKRVNSGADPLTVQEIRNAICSGPALEHVKKYLKNCKNYFSLLIYKEDIRCQVPVNKLCLYKT